MFSRFHHRRGPSTSTPTSPVPPADSSTWEPASSAAVHTHTHDKHAIVTQQPVSSSNNASNMPLAAPPAASKASKASTTSKDLTTASTTSAASATTPATNSPPSLPPISRMSVLTVPSEIKYDLAKGTSKTDAAQSRPSFSAPSSSLDTRRPSATKIASPQTSHESPQAQPAEPVFIGGLALANLNLRRSGPQDLSAAAAVAAAAASAEAKRPTSSTYSTSPPAPTTTSPASYSTSERRMSRQKPPPPPINTSLTSRQHLSPTVGAQAKDARPGSRSATSFVTPTDLQSSAAAAAAASAVNAANDVHNTVAPASVNSSATTAAVAANARTKKSRPFLKNPVSSLLGRRKTTASTPETASWAASKTDTDVPVYVPFRGTRVHDFSAPRQPRIVTNEPPVPASTAAAAAAAAVANSAGLTSFSKTAAPRQPPAPSPNPSLRPQSADASALSQAVPQTTSLPPSAAVTPDPNGYASAPQAYVAPFPNLPNVPNAQKTDLRTGPVRTLSQGTLQTLQENDTISFEDQAERPSMEADAAVAGQGQGQGQGDPALAQAASIRAPSTTTHSRVASADVSSILKSSPSTGTTRSRNVSISDLSPNSNAGGQPSTSATTPGSVVSALPKHMKSTSSRFSFMVGSSEEKVLEERHRQKQAEKATTNTGARDSRYYDSDEEDFDYEAMMDEDDFEDDAHLYGDDDEHVGLGDQDFLNPTSVPEPVDVDDDDAYKSEYEDAVADPVPAKPGIEIEDDDPEGLDPNNDQENFAGFVFQRSNPASSLVTPTSAGMLVTPRDATGRVIGFAMTKDTTPDLNPPSAKSLSPMDPGLLNAAMESHGTSSTEMSPDMSNDADVGGLGIQHMNMEENEDDYRATENLDDYEAESDYGEPTVTVQHVSDPFDNEQYGQPLPAQPVPVQRDDELYFDQGLADELDFGAPDNSVPFDENLFDLPDTDRYGRPLPGVFAAAQAAQAAQRDAMAAAVEAAGRRVEVSSVSESAATGQTQEISTSTSLRRQLPPIMTDAERVAAYQAALSEAAFKAAAQGKFRRDSESNASDMDFLGRASPPPTTSPPVIEHDILIGTAVGLGLSYGAGESAIKDAASVPAAAPVATELPSHTQSDNAAQSHLAYAFTSHREDEFQHNFEEDDYLEDMDDYDFDDDIIAEANAEALANDMDGFYGQEFNFYSAPTNQGPSAKEPLQYAHGGYFIPQGLGRSISGRVNVSREPNLTPITERSEYSNRNSVMSLALPPYGSSAELRSPGLAQLALIADDNDMSLSALLRLRNRTFGGGSQVSSREGSPMLIPPGGLSFPGSAPQSASASALGFDRDRDRGDRENASSPYDQHLTPAQLQLLQKQYALPASHYQHHHRMNSVTSQLSRGAGSSDYNSEGAGSDCGSPTLTNLQAITSIGEAIPPVPPIPQSLPMSPIPASSCTPVLEEEGESGAAGLREPSSTTNDLSASALSGHSSASGSGLWMRSPVTGSINSKQNSEQQIQDLQHQLQLKERENELIQRENEKMQQRILALEQKSAAGASADL